MGYTLGTGTTGQHVHLYHPLTLGTGTTGIPIRVTDSFYPSSHDDIEGDGVMITSVEEAHMTTVRGHGVA